MERGASKKKTRAIYTSRQTLFRDGASKARRKIPDFLGRGKNANSLHVKYLFLGSREWLSNVR